MSEQVFEGRLREIFNNEYDPSRGNILDWSGWLVTQIRSLLGQVDLPPKEFVIAKVRELLRAAFAAIDVPGPDAIIEPIIESVIIHLVSRAYDQLAKQ